MDYSRRRFARDAALVGAVSALRHAAPLSAFPAVQANAPSAGPAGESAWRPCAFGDVSVGGDLASCARLNAHRLQHRAYQVPGVFAGDTAQDFPGDWVGRAILATTLLARSGVLDHSQAGEIVRQLPAHFNREGYLGASLDLNAPNELQLGSHAWLMRGLCEYVAWTRDEHTQEILDNIVQKLGLPMAQLWSRYPITNADRKRNAGGVIGSSQKVGNWILTTDIGSIFLLLDGLSQAWQRDRSPQLKSIIDEGIDYFLRMDLLGVKAQAHASLTSLRGLLRMYGLTGDKRLLTAVEDRYRLYRGEVMTENYANYNWFGRRVSWTEPCAIVDSFMVATQLWQYASNPEYLEDAHLIWFNGLGHGQRSTGGYGCDSCAGVHDPFLGMTSIYEAYFCCTMRAGEGHSAAIQSTYHIRPGELAVTLFSESTADLDLGNGRIKLEQSTQYPYDASVRLKVVASTLTKPLKLRLFKPSWVDSARLALNSSPLASGEEQGFLVAEFVPHAGDAVTLNAKLKNWVRPTHNPHSIKGYHVFHAGPLVLGHQGTHEIPLPDTAELVSQGKGRYQVEGKDVILARINDLNELALPSWDPLDPNPADPHRREQLGQKILTELPAATRQILFRTT